jgi:hypothetical protein
MVASGRASSCAIKGVMVLTGRMTARQDDVVARAL